MGKAEQEQPLPSRVASGDPEQNVEAGCGCRCSRIRKFIGLRCIFILLFSAAVFLSAVFWLPPFLHYADQKDLHSDSKYKGGFWLIPLFILGLWVAALFHRREGIDLFPFWNLIFYLSDLCAFIICDICVLSHCDPWLVSEKKNVG